LVKGTEVNHFWRTNFDGLFAREVRGYYYYMEMITMDKTQIKKRLAELKARHEVMKQTADDEGRDYHLKEREEERQMLFEGEGRVFDDSATATVLFSIVVCRLIYLPWHYLSCCAASHLSTSSGINLLYLPILRRGIASSSFRIVWR
jgi:hypothetical protein